MMGSRLVFLFTDQLKQNKSINLMSDFDLSLLNLQFYYFYKMHKT